uniref:Peptidase M14 domain-containing protein n=3 Tax=Palpitomonas bilix TaxID=652834 RepID=A0A7S3G6W0_9EUKA|mmetsp:Transcript_24378/g.61685  ORF Transcript_24378/g.61685 Transcript_24378/m.61685 type:complete len:197 (+) Transcript_24378:159-749(+)
MVKDIQKDREVLMVIDLHGHSRKKNIFIYGNALDSAPSNTVTERTFPFMLSRISNVFSFQDCCFKVQKAKESAARVVYWKELGIPYSYTIESSFCSCSTGPMKDVLFTPEHLETLGGRELCEALLDFCNPDSLTVAVRELEIYMSDHADKAGDSDLDEDGQGQREKGSRKKIDKKKKLVGGKKKLVSKKKKEIKII